jgi:hypothetical protein
LALFYLRNLPKKDGKIKMNYRVVQYTFQLFRNIVQKSQDVNDFKGFSPPEAHSLGNYLQEFPQFVIPIPSKFQA